MNDENYSSKIAVAASEFSKEREYWLDKLSGEWEISRFPYDNRRGTGERRMESVPLTLSETLVLKLLKLSGGSDIKLHMILVAALVGLIYKYTETRDILLGAPIYKQEVSGKFLNTVLVLRNLFPAGITFKELLLKVRETIIEADENQNYPVRRLAEKLNLRFDDGNCPFFEIVLMLENIHDREYIGHIKSNVVFSMVRTGEGIEGKVEYNASLYGKESMERVSRYFLQFMQNALNNIDTALESVDILPAEELHRLLDVFNDTDAPYPETKTIHRLFEEQAAKTPDNIAVAGMEDRDGVTAKGLTYRELNDAANLLARELLKGGLEKESVVGVMMERSPRTIAALLAILKAGGAYLPIEPGLPEERILHMLDDAGAEFLITEVPSLQNIAFTTLQNFEAETRIQVKRTPARSHIRDFNSLPVPDRALIDLRNYRHKIGMASVTNCISIQSTRGCPYECLYCHKIWSKCYVNRSAENIFGEIEHFYKKGVTNFAVIDDCFNLNREKSSEVFQLILKNKLDLQIFFPNGLRGDIMTPDYIDLMVEAGTRGINLSLETASPRLQELLKKKLDLDKFRSVLDYIATTHPNVILELATMHGFPGESEEEAMLTLDFIKSIKWLHFPYIHILKIFPNTEMEEFALEQGVSKENIMASKDRAFHELPETLPFPKSFTRKYQAGFLNDYFLSKERLTHVLPHQMKIMSETALAQKYNAYLPVEINSIEDIINFAQLEGVEVPQEFKEPGPQPETVFDLTPQPREPQAAAKKILFLDLSQHFSSHSMLYNVVEQPLGLIYLLTYINKHFGDRIHGRIYKAGNDFDSFEELRDLLEEYKPDLIGIRTLTFFKDFFHATVSLIRQWGFDAPIITGGPYASSDYDTILKDKNVNLVVLGEGEYTMGELLEEMLANGFKIPSPDVLDKIKGISYPLGQDKASRTRSVLLLDRLPANLTAAGEVSQTSVENPGVTVEGSNLAYVMYTSGSLGKPKGVMVEHRQVLNCIQWMQDTFKLDESAAVAQRTNLSFDPSVWEMFWPLFVGAGVRVISQHQSKDALQLIKLMREDNGLTVMYCPATLVNAMAYLLKSQTGREKLKMPWFIIGAEPISMEVVKSFYEHYEGKIVNTYGPTEGTINNTYYVLEPDDPRSIVPIGKPVTNNRLYILSTDLHPLPVGMSGEICIAGHSLARGYINNRAQTDAFFLDNPFGDGKLYKTGDIGRWLEDGNLEIQGRVDDQVKIRGHRIELGEIETALHNRRDIDECLVVARDDNDLQQSIRECKKCGIWSNYPGITINSDGICGICENIHKYKTLLDRYFLSMDDLERKIKEGNKDRDNEYDCILVYACERVATYALYKLVDMGLKVLTVTYDSGHYDQSSLDRISEITKKIGVDHMFLRHQRSDDILKTSLKMAQTMCKGCIHTSSSLAADLAYKKGIPFVIGETLSRGQIVENKLYKFMEMGIYDVKEIETEIAKLQRNTAMIDKKIFDIIGIKNINDGSIYDQVEFIDFYRYCDVPHDEMIKFLNSKDPYWENLNTQAIYSTDCKICTIGNFNHLKEKGYHYTGSAKSWDKRLGLTSLKELKDDLKIDLTAEGHAEFLRELGYEEEKDLHTIEKHLCAYLVANKEITVSQLRDYLAGEVPEYMIPSYFVHLDRIPLTSNGKIDRKALPRPEGFRPKLKETFVAPESDLEKVVAEVWKDVLKVDMVGVQDNFFELGGSSLDIIHVSSKLKEKIDREIPVVTMFSNPTISSLADHLNQEGISAAPAGLPKDRSETVKASKNRLKESRRKRQRV
jgi:amino acid adenylation domain-containing protein